PGHERAPEMSAARNPVLTWTLCFLSIVLLCGAFAQRHRLVELRNERQRLIAEGQGTTPGITSSTTFDNATDGVVATGEQKTVSSDLLQLRDRVHRLTQRRDELASIGLENQRLSEQLAIRATNGPPETGYVRKSQAKFAGYATPENTLQTFLWAIHNRNYATYLDTLVPELVQQL